MMEEYLKELISEASFSGKAVGITSKMWIMKTGKVFSTGGGLHYQWAFQNKKMLEDTFGISFEGINLNDSEQKVRLHLIKQGMFRLNHEARGNRVTIEGVINYFNKRVKDSIVALVMDNPDDFALLNVTLFDDGARNVVKQKSANLFNMGEREKVDKIMEIIQEQLYKTDEELIWESYEENNPLYKKYPSVVIDRLKKGEPYTETEVVRVLKGNRALIKAKAILKNLRKRDDGYDYALHTDLTGSPLRKPMPYVSIERKRRGSPQSEWREVDRVYGLDHVEMSRWVADEYRKQDTKFVIRTVIKENER